jgi:small neutral amino acid transporter SnatA (MarC family)
MIEPVLNLLLAVVQDPVAADAPPEFMGLFMGLALAVGGAVTAIGAYLNWSWVMTGGRHSGLLLSLLGPNGMRILQMVLGVLMTPIGVWMVVDYFAR